MRYEGISKMGFYATPRSMTDKIIQRLHFDGPARLFDPCCGEGEALADVAKLTPESLTYGIEIDGHRADVARTQLDKVVHSPYERARVETASMQLCWLNPPYDQQSGLGGLAFRKELVFLRDISKFVAPNGVLVFIIPRYTLGQDMVNALVNRYTDLSVYRFDDDDYQAYKQVVVFGRRREKALSSFRNLSEEEREMRNNLMMYGSDDSIPMPYLDESDEQCWTVPAAPSLEDILFRGYLLDLRELRQDIANSDVFRITDNLIQSASQPTNLKRPLLPYRKTHLATLIAAGALNGAVGIGHDRHVVVGITRKIVDRQIVTSETGDDPTILDTEHYATVVRTIEPDGTIRDLA